MPLYTELKSGTYHDSVSLMVLSSHLTAIEGIKNAAVMMGTEHNQQIMQNNGLIGEAFGKATSSDLVIGLEYGTDAQLEQAQTVIVDFFQNKNKKKRKSKNSIRVQTMESALHRNADANFAIISVPGRYAKNEAMKALNNGMHVLLFSDNVSLEAENELKDKALVKNLLMMGPDCGTAIINGLALGFANVVRRGNIGVVAAAGTGLQEATVLVDKLGGGISQAIGTGGRDVKEEVGGKMMLHGIDALEKDDYTDVIVLISKPPSRSVIEKIKAKVKKITKPVVACLLGGDYSLINDMGMIPVQTLEDAAVSAVNLSKGKQPDTTFFTLGKEEMQSLIEDESSKLREDQKYVRGLYSGGTLCYEGILMMRETVDDVYSNVALREDLVLKDVETSKENTLIDMGEDYFTDGLPHPMIDSKLRKERLVKEARDREVAVILLDVVLGYGSHEDPSGTLLEAITEARLLAGKEGRHLSFVASVCGTENDPQSLEEQQKKLTEAGVIVMPSNAQAARIAAFIAAKGETLKALTWGENDG